MHILDIILGVFALISIIIGIKRGLSGELIRIAAMVIGFIVAFVYYTDLTPYLTSIKVPLHIKNAVSFFVIYTAVALVILLIGWIVQKIINLSVLGWIDRLLGAVVGLLKTAIVAWIICLSISSFVPNKADNDFSRSIVYKAYSRLPKDLHLKAVLKIRDSIRDYLRLKENKTVENKQEKLESIKNTFDSLLQVRELEQVTE